MIGYKTANTTVSIPSNNGMRGIASKSSANELAADSGIPFNTLKSVDFTASSDVDLDMDWSSLISPACAEPSDRAESVSDGLIMSLTQLGRVDIEYIAGLTSKTRPQVISELKGSIYQNPDTWDECYYKGWETAEEYLSGNLMRKRRVAQAASIKYHGRFDDNVRAIEKELPPTVGARDIYVTLGSPWIPTGIIDDFITHILRLNRPFHGTKHDEYTGTWEIPDKNAFWYSHNVSSTHVYGTSRISALHILERTLNMRTVSVTNEIDCGTAKNGKKRVIDREETALALEKQQKLIDTFRKWVWKDADRRTLLEDIFDDRFGSVRRRIFDGSFLRFPTMDPSVTLYPYQKNAVARILFSPNTLLAHDVGSGKTFIMIAAGMELKRMGLSQKNLYAVPNNIIGQWKDIFLQLYPNAKLLCVDPKSFTPDKRNAVLRSIRDDSFDAIIMAHSCFDMIPLSRDYYIEELKEDIARMREVNSNETKSNTSTRHREKVLKDELAKMMGSFSIDFTVCFDELGVTRLFVDEAHHYKNVPLDTKTDRVLGISATGSKKCKDMLDKVHVVQKAGGGVIMGTGTPITNSITDAFVMQKYLQSGELALLDLNNFDSWVGMFAERVTDFEVDVDTSSYRLATRFSKFHNLPELTALLSSIADFHSADEGAELPEIDGYDDALIGKTEELEDYLKEISSRADYVRSGYVSRTEDNMLKITTDGRKAALDVRLVNPDAPFTYWSKVYRCAENVSDIFHKTAAERSTQLVFCDYSTPKDGFNIYDELKRLLILMGVPEKEIAFVHDATTEAKRNALFAAVRKGDIRVLVGSTFKLGLGVNVQDKLIALHHVDTPWRPADLTQRNGRILRQGNTNKKVRIFRYITEGSFDAYSWQLLETKQRFIVSLLSGSMTQRSGSDIEGTVLDYAEVKALAVGNPLIKKRVETANELTRCLTLQRKTIEQRVRTEKELSELPDRIARQEDVIRRCEDDIESLKTGTAVYDANTRRTFRKTIFEAIKSGEMELEDRVLMTYQGFDVVLPAAMDVNKPYVWLSREARYYVEMGDSEKGILLRIDNYLEALPEHLNKLKEVLSSLVTRQAELKAELGKNDSYTETITALQNKLRQIDKKLGVSA